MWLAASRGITYGWRAQVVAGTRRARLLCLGDSLTAGCNSTGNEMSANARSGGYPHQLAGQFVSAPAHSDAFIGDSNAADSTTLTAYDSRIAFGSGWISDTTDTPTGGGYILEQGSATSSSLGFTPAGTFDSFTVWYEKFTGSPQYTVNVDGGSSLGTLAANASSGIGVASFLVSRGTHTINVASNGTAAGKIFGIEAWDSTTTAIQIIGAGADGWRTDQWTQNHSNSWDPLAFALFLVPDLTIVCLGKNEQQQGISQAAFQANLTTLVQALLNAGSQVVILAPPLSSAGAFGMSEAAQLAYETNMSAVASATGATFYSLTQSRANWGSFSAANTAGFMSTDGVHCTTAGYLDVAKALITVVGQ